MSYHSIWRFLLLCLCIAVFVKWCVLPFASPPKSQSAPAVWSISQFVKELEGDSIAEVVAEEQGSGIKVTGKLKDKPDAFVVYFFPESSFPVEAIHNSHVIYSSKPPEKTSTFLLFLMNWFPLIFLIVMWIYISRAMMPGRGKNEAFSLGASRARVYHEKEISTRFSDVAGCDEAKEEVREFSEFLKDPAKFSRLGGHVPCGVLLVGSPGSGKTLLARAIAGESSASFLSIPGSEFVEMFVGVGASRVRDLFKQAKKLAPSIIFIDEIDAVGRHRGAGLGGGHDEREQTLNQLLVEMDGFEGNEGIVVIAATNRPDVLDPALLRPGRFDRQVVMSLPDIRGREAILKVHMRKILIVAGKYADQEIAINTIAHTIARGTPGFSGADLANIVNEAALFAAREGKKESVTLSDFEQAKDKIYMGVERRSMVMSEREKKITAYHESGHAIVGRLTPSHDPVYKVSIIPRGRALGVTAFLPEEDRYSINREELDGKLTALFGGRVAEEIVFGESGLTTGAYNDMEKATEIARNMIMRWGFSKTLGPVTYAGRKKSVFLGKDIVERSDISEETSREIDVEVRIIIEEAYKKARSILEENREKLDAMAQALITHETLEAEHINAIMNGQKPAFE